MTEGEKSVSEHRSTIDLVRASMVRRRRSERILRGLGLSAICFAFLMLATLIVSLVSSGYSAFVQTHITLDVFVDPEEIREKRLPRGGFDDALTASLGEYLPGVDLSDRGTKKQVEKILSNGAQFELRDLVVADSSLIGQTINTT